MRVSFLLILFGEGEGGCHFSYIGLLFGVRKAINVSIVTNNALVYVIDLMTLCLREPDEPCIKPVGIRKFSSYRVNILDR